MSDQKRTNFIIIHVEVLNPIDLKHLWVNTPTGGDLKGANLYLVLNLSPTTGTHIV